MPHLSVIELRDGTVDLEAGVVRRANLVGLTVLEHRLLVYLGERAGQIVGREELLSAVWGYQPRVRTRTIDTHALRLREKIEVDPKEPAHLQAVYGRGLRLDAVVRYAEPSRPAPSSRPTRLVGRDAERAQLAALLQGGARLVTLLGPPGAGKTRLAEEIAASSGRETVLIELGARSPGELEPLTLQALGLGKDADLLQALSRKGPLLLLLDGCDPVAPAIAPRIGAWLDAAPALTVLATSRLALDLPHEHRFALGPLGLPEAVALFSDRARQVAPTFTADKPTLERLVEAVDRLPLMIELLAARAQVVSARELCERLDRRLDLLSIGGDDRARATLDASLRGLPAPQQETLRDLATFCAPFTLQDAEAVLSAEQVLDRVQALVDHSLVQVTHQAAGVSYRLLDLVRERVREVLPAPQETWRRHAAWFGRWHDKVPATPEEHARMVASLPELQIALDRWFEQAPELAATCAVSLLSLLLDSDRDREVVELAVRLEALPCSPELRVQILMRHANARFDLEQYGEALALLDRIPALPTSRPTALRARRFRLWVLAYHNPHDLDLEREIEACREADENPVQRNIFHRICARLWHLQGRCDKAAPHVEILLEAIPTERVDAWNAVVCAADAEQQGQWLRAERLMHEAWEKLGVMGVHSFLGVGFGLVVLQVEWGKLDEELLVTVQQRMDAICSPLAPWMSEAVYASAALYRGEQVPTLSGWRSRRTDGRLGLLVADVQLLAGDTQGARRSLEIYPKERPYMRAMLQSQQALVEQADGAPDVARALLQEAEAFYLQARVPIDYALHLAIGAQLAAEAGETTLAQERLARAHRLVATVPRPPTSRLAFWLKRAQAAVSA